MMSKKRDIERLERMMEVVEEDLTFLANEVEAMKERVKPPMHYNMPSTTWTETFASAWSSPPVKPTGTAEAAVKAVEHATMDGEPPRAEPEDPGYEVEMTGLLDLEAELYGCRVGDLNLGEMLEDFNGHKVKVSVEVVE